ncbi:hypothetical protein DXT91_08600 [Agrobacterium tumefaciens]|nr:hypothetical protein [Agrobacterium tumefaciens]
MRLSAGILPQVFIRQKARENFCLPIFHKRSNLLRFGQFASMGRPINLRTGDAINLGRWDEKRWMRTPLLPAVKVLFLNSQELPANALAGQNCNAACS